MYGGAKSDAHGGCHDYASAQRVLERASKTPTGKQRTKKPDGFPLGGHSKSVTWVRELDNGAIAFQLYTTDVVVWAPDNSVEIDNFGTVTTSQFARRFLPEGIHLHYPVERRGYSGGANTIGYTGRSEDGETMRAICQGSVVRFTEACDGRWAPDPGTCDPIKLPVGLDRKKARELAKEYHFAEFEMWLSMAPMHLAQTDEPVEHVGYKFEQCLWALEARDWRRAAAFLPAVREPTGFGTAERMKPLDIVCRHGEWITMSSLSKLKLAMWEEKGLLIYDERKTWDHKTFDRGMARVKQMTALGVHTYGMGPS